MWFSFFFTEKQDRTLTFSAGEETSFGVNIKDGHADSAVRAIINGERDKDLDRNQWTREASRRFPEGPNMVVGRCLWGKTDEEPDTVEVYRAWDAPGYDVVLPEKPVSVTKGMIPQEMIKAIKMNVSIETPFDEIRVGPTLHSVMLGTVPMTAPAASRATVSRDTRRLSAAGQARLEKWILQNIATLSQAGKLSSKPIKIEAVSAPVVVVDATKNDVVTFQSTKNMDMHNIKWAELETSDRAMLALLVAYLSPNDAQIQAAVGVYLEGLGKTKAAKTCYARSTPSTVEKLQGLFVNPNM
jgi:hypothetical protein